MMKSYNHTLRNIKRLQLFALISDIAACEAHNNGKLTVYLPTRPLNYNVKYSYRRFAKLSCKYVRKSKHNGCVWNYTFVLRRRIGEENVRRLKWMNKTKLSVEIFKIFSCSVFLPFSMLIKKWILSLSLNKWNTFSLSLFASFYDYQKQRTQRSFRNAYRDCDNVPQKLRGNSNTYGLSLVIINVRLRLRHTQYFLHISADNWPIVHKNIWLP